DVIVHNHRLLDRLIDGDRLVDGDGLGNRLLLTVVLNRLAGAHFAIATQLLIADLPAAVRADDFLPVHFAAEIVILLLDRAVGLRDLFALLSAGWSEMLDAL